MNLLVISNMYPSTKDPVYGTFVQSFVENIKQQNKDGFVQTIVIKGRDGNLAIKVWKYVKFYLSIFFNLMFNWYDIVYVHTIAYPIPPIRLVSIFRDLPLVFNVHGGDVLTRGSIANKLKKLAAPLVVKAKIVVAPSFFFKNILLREFPHLSEGQIFVSPSGGVDELFYRDKIKTPNEIFTIGYVSRIDEGKGWDTLLRAVSILHQNNLKIKLLIAGRGAEESKLKEMIERLALNEFVDYVGPIPYKSLPAFYRKLDLFIFPTCLEESLGLVGLEAMACKIPVIGSKIGGLTDYIKDGYNGFFFTPNKSDDLSEKICGYINLPNSEKIVMGNHAYETSMLYRTSEAQKILYDRLKDILKIC